MYTIWVVDDDKSIRWVLQKALGRAHMNCEVFSEAQTVLDRLSSERPHVLITDIRMPGENGLKLLHKVKQQYPNLPVIVMTAFSDLDTAVSAYQGGAFDYLPKPFELQYATELIIRAANQVLPEEFVPVKSVEGFQQGIIGQTVVMHDVICMIGRLSKSTVSVLITGDAGVGKRLFAKVLHAHSPKANQPFIEVQVNSVPADQLNGVLFDPKSGALYRAKNGTLFLNNVSHMPLEVQTKLLNACTDNSVRIIASSRSNLHQLVSQGQFSEHLYHRLNSIEVYIPCLQQRLEDLPLLVDYFLKQFAKELNLPAKTVSAPAISMLSQYVFTGNVRQLETICRHLTVATTSAVIEPKDLPEEIRLYIRQNSLNSTVELLQPDSRGYDLYQQEFKSSLLESMDVISPSTGQWTLLLRQQARRLLDLEESDVMRILTDQFEAIVIEAALEATKGRRKEAAERLGIGRNTIARKITDLNLE